ncbi:MAG: prepilin peptidase, partial [Planctomycetales bacterium]
MNNLLTDVLFLPAEIRLAWLFAVGACIGSFINVCVVRFPVSNGLWFEWTSLLGPSKCCSCDKAISWRHNIPILSWLILRGKCAYCGAKFSVRYMLVELTVGSAFAGLYYWDVLHLGIFHPTLAPLATPAITHALYLNHVVLFCLLTTAFLIDAEHWIIPDAITVTGALFGLVLVSLCPYCLPRVWWFAA